MALNKYFAMTIIAASVAMSACSSDDDDDTGGSTDAGSVDAGGVDAGGVDAGGVDAGGVDAGGTDAGGVDAGGEDAGGTDGTEPEPVVDMSTMTGTSVLDLARGTDDGAGTTTEGVAELTSLVMALGNYPALLNALDDEDTVLTVFAPNNAAIDGIPADTDAAALENTLAYHVVVAGEGETAFNTSAVAADATFPMTLTTEQGGTLEIREAAGGGYEVVGDDGVAVALMDAPVTTENGSVVYVIDSVLAAPAAAAPGGTDGGDPGTGETDGDAGPVVGAAGSTYAALQADADLSEFLALADSSNYKNSLESTDNNHFVIFAPENGTFDAAATTSVVSYIHVRNDNTATGPVVAGVYSGTGAEALEFTVAGEGETLTVNGAAAQYVETSSGGALYVFGEQL